MGELFSKFFDVISNIWHIKVATIDNNDLTIANIIIALFIFIIGFKLSRRLSKFFVVSIPSINALNENSKATAESVTFYSLLLFFTFTSLSIAQIPLKAFALLGGALAIGIGFGSQNIIKNFISGLILMIEQPIRVGDIVIAEGTEARVIRIGARSTHIRTFDNIDILVPNSILLEHNVINWTLSDNEIRTRVIVGVAHGSDTRKVEKLLKDVVKQNKSVLEGRDIPVYLKEFGENALIFEVQFWCEIMRPSDQRSVESEVRHEIYRAFNEHGIITSTPQRELHIDKPIEVHII